MRVLLDSHVLIWMFDGSPRLDEAVRRRLSTVDAIYISAASVWELAIKRALGKIEIDIEQLTEKIHLGGFTPLPITTGHGLIAGDLPRLHGDPFDRMLVAQARAENLKLVSDDGMLRRYRDHVEFF